MTAYANPFEKVAASCSVSTEFMDNFRRVRLIEPQRDFLALQNIYGNTILLSISTDHRLHLTVEKTGSKTGWEQFEISPHMNGTPMEVSQIAAVQSTDLSRIDLIISAKNTSGPVKDHLLVSLGHSSDSLLNNWDWKEIPDDRKTESPLVISDIFIANSGTKPTIVVDTQSNDGRDSIQRYYINPDGSQYWKSHGLAANLTAGTVQMCVGRSYHQRVDGIYTLGKNNNETHIIYTPLYNERNPGIAAPVTNLAFPSSQVGASMALAAASLPKYDTRGMTTLFVAGAGQLYYLHGGDQSNGTALKLLQSDDLYHDVEQLYVNISNHKIAIWGRNAHQQIFYSTCDLDDFETPDKWSKPLPILNGVTQLSPYINKANDCLTFFAAGSGNNLIKATQTADSSIWNSQPITLPDPGVPAKKGKAYITHVVVHDINNCPLANVDVTLSVEGSAGVYINDEYFALDSSPQKVRTDSSGELHITEWVDGCRGTSIKAQLSPEYVTDTNPMHKSMQKMARLDSVEKLNNAQYQDHKGNTYKLIPAGAKITDEQAQQLVSSVQALSHAWNNVSNQAIEIASKLEDVVGQNLERYQRVHDLDSGFHYVTHLASDVLRWAADTADSVVSVVKDTGSDVWHFIVKNGDKVVGFVIKTCDEVMKGLELLWKTIVGRLNDLWNYLMFVFDVADVMMTKDIFKCFVGFYFDQAKDWLKGVEGGLDEGIDSAKSALHRWAEDDSIDFSALRSPIMGFKGGHDNSKALSAPSKLLQSHFRHNVANAQTVPFKGFETVKDDLEHLLHKLAERVHDADGEIRQLIKDVRALIVYKGSLLDPDFVVLLRKIAVDIGELALTALRAILDVVIELFIILVDAIRAVLTKPFYIPVLSESLDYFFSLKDVSLLDIILLIGALPATTVYKIIHNKAPFPKDDPTTQLILSSPNYQAFKTAVKTATDQNIKWAKDSITISDRFKDIIFGTLHIAGGMANTLKTMLEMVEEEENGEAPGLSLPIGVLGLVAYGKEIIAHVLETPQAVKGSAVEIFSNILGSVGILQQLAFRILPGEMSGVSMEPIAAGVDVVLSSASMIPLTVDAFELCNEQPQPEAKEMSAGILDALSGILGHISTVTGFAGMLDQDEEFQSKHILVGIAGEAGTIAADLEIAEGFVMIA
ncbi:MAG: hypothetical protein IPM36_20355 [Lewinellaceae bacterium]|nr:hypothetical protein [Lewinellaceae bacterium]